LEKEILEEIRTELRELRILYKGLIEKIIPVEEEPTPEEKKAIEEKDDLADERQMMQALS